MVLVVRISAMYTPIAWIVLCARYFLIEIKTDVKVEREGVRGEFRLSIDLFSASRNYNVF